MSRRNSAVDSDMNISQKSIRPKIRAYLTAINAPPELINAFKRGYCNGLASLAIFGLYLQCENRSKTKRAMLDDWIWLKKTLIKLSRWDEDLNSLRKRDRANIERLISHMEFIQHVSTYMPFGQGDLHQILEDTLNRKPTREYTLAGLFNADDFTKTINVEINGVNASTSLLAQLLQHDRRMILISSGKHTLGLFKNGEEISLFDTNHEGGMRSFSASQPSPLIDAIFNAYHSTTSMHIPFGFRIFTFAKTPGIYAQQVQLLEAINGPHSSPAKKPSRIHSALHIAARIGSQESMHYYLDKNANPDNFSQALRTPLYIAASKGHLAEVKFLIDQGADVNKVCRQGKTPLMRAAEKGQLEILKYMIENNKNSTFQDVITALSRLSTVDQRQRLIWMIDPAKMTQLFRGPNDISKKLLQYSVNPTYYSSQNQTLFFARPKVKYEESPPGTNFHFKLQ